MPRVKKGFSAFRTGLSEVHMLATEIMKDNLITTIGGALVVLLILVVAIIIAIASCVKSRNVGSTCACIYNLRIIDGGKEQWAMVNHKTNGEPVVVSEINQYIKGGTTPICPQGGTYQYNAIGVDPSCSGFDKGPHGEIRPHRFCGTSLKNDANN
jgi:hypothetical protein